MKPEEKQVIDAVYNKVRDGAAYPDFYYATKGIISYELNYRAETAELYGVDSAVPRLDVTRRWRELTVEFYPHENSSEMVALRAGSLMLLNFDYQCFDSMLNMDNFIVQPLNLCFRSATGEHLTATVMLREVPDPLQGVSFMNCP